MELSQGEIIQKLKTQSFMNIVHMVLELWPGHGLLYGSKSRGNNSKSKKARVVFLVHDTLFQCDACTY